MKRITGIILMAAVTGATLGLTAAPASACKKPGYDGYTAAPGYGEPVRSALFQSRHHGHADIPCPILPGYDYDRR